MITESLTIIKILLHWQTVYTLKGQNIGMRDVTSFYVLPIYYIIILNIQTTPQRRQYSEVQQQDMSQGNNLTQE